MKKMICAILLAISIVSNTAIAERLYVFVPSEMRAKVLQDKIAAVCAGVEVTVFGRVKDFSKRLKDEPPHAIMALSPVVEKNATFKKLLQGTKAGTVKESYVVASVGKDIDLSNISSLKLGVIDILGRKDMKKYISKLLNAKVKLKRVTKVEDLLPLLTFNAVDAIFVSESVFNLVKGKTEMDLRSKKLDISIGLVSTAMADAEQSEKLLKCVNAFPEEINSAMGVDQWKSL